MVPSRRSQPIWRSVIGPVSLGLLWPSLLCGFWFVFLSEFGNPLQVGAANLRAEDAPAATAEVVKLERVSFEDELTRARVVVAGQVVVDQELVHLGPFQVQADRELVAFDLIPTGSETADFAEVQVFAMDTGEQVAAFAGHGPAWNEQGQLAFTGPSRVAMTFDVQTREVSAAAGDPEAEAEPEADAPVAIQSLPADFRPTTIKVRHHSRNHCRPNTPVDQVEEIPLGEYVARVLPAEVPPSWNLSALRAQAIAARTYALNKVFHNRNGKYPFDISDWANHQMMCDYRNPRTDEAAASTAGLILSPLADPPVLPINALYSAENAHPTRKHGSLAYLDSVPDVNALGKVRRGHGWGLSQLGAQRFAKQGRNFCQILGHYYRRISLNNLDAPDTRLGCLIVNDQSGFAAGAGLHIRAVASLNATELTVEIHRLAQDNAPVWASYANPEAAAPSASAETPDAPVEAAADAATGTEDASAEPEPEAAATPPPPTDSEEPGVAAQTEEAATPTPDPPAETDAETVAEERTEDRAAAALAWPVTLDMTARELLWLLPPELAAGDALEVKLKNGTEILDTVNVVVDRTGPRRITFALLNAEATDDGEALSARAAPGTRISVGRNWIWEQSAMYFSDNSGALVQDPAASDGVLWYGDPTRHQAGTWYGPYTSLLPAGQSYRALFQLKLGAFPPATSNPLAADATQPIARLDVAHAQGLKILGFRDLYLTDFSFASAYATVPVDFHLFEAVTDLEFRVSWRDTYPLAWDNVSVVTYPFADWAQSALPLPLVPGTPVQDLRVVAFDEADNISTLFALNLGTMPSGATAAASGEDCSWLGDCRRAAINLAMPEAIE